MDHFHQHNGVVHCEQVPLPAIAESVGTPVFVYSTATLRRHASVMKAALAALDNPLIAYAVKANPNGALLATLAREGLGADIVSGGEYRRARSAGIAPEKIVFSGVGKTEAEMALALEGGLFQFNLESLEEAETLSRVAVALDHDAPIAFRVNPDVDPETHQKISTGAADSKFGIPIAQALDAYRRVSGMPRLNIQGVAVHIGSQLISLEPLERTFTRIGELIAALRTAGFGIAVADLGGGLGVPYDPAALPPPLPDAYGAMVRRIAGNWGTRLVFEPGRLITGNAGILLTQIIRVKPGVKHPFVIVDAAMNDLMRPALYDAWHAINAVAPSGERMIANVVGPVCESGDTFATAREMDAAGPGDLLLFRTAGAYAATMSNSYNSRPIAPEVLVDGERWAVVRRRVDIDEMIAAELLPEWLT